MLIFSGSSNLPLAKKVANQLGSPLSKIEIHTFPDRENRVRIIDKVLDKDVIVVQSTGVSPNRFYMELFFILDGLKRSGARSVTLISPYLGYQRQDHIFRSGEAVSLEVIVNLLKTLRVDSVISLDLHSLRIEEFFKTKKIKLSHLSALSVFAKEVEKIAGFRKRDMVSQPVSASSNVGRQTILASKTLDYNDIVLVSPDMGGIRRIKQLAEMLDGKFPYVSIEKNRDLSSGEVESVKINGKVGKTAIIVDDMISTGKTLIAAADLLSKNGAEEIYVMATHGILSGNSSQDLQNSIIKKVIITDSIGIRPNRRFGKLEVISVANLIAGELKATSH
ncbi:MAG: ribose-phosphate pyrophosphokinase [Candidatus Levybacteria bacterium]|nr:ribose-phosphate pyrophosphokinase [Candidatus Levybacteria bacterium]